MPVCLDITVDAASHAGSGGDSGLSADVTWDAGYTEAPDETAHGDYMKLMAAAGLVFDYVHLKYLAEGDLWAEAMASQPRTTNPPLLSPAARRGWAHFPTSCEPEIPANSEITDVEFVRI